MEQKIKYTSYVSNDTRREIYRLALRHLTPKQVKEIVGEHKKSFFWASRAKVSDEAIERLLQSLPNEAKIQVLELIERDLKDALSAVEKEIQYLKKPS